MQNLKTFLDRAVVKVAVCEVRPFMDGLTKMERDLAAPAAAENRMESPAKFARRITIHRSAGELPGTVATEPPCMNVAA